jgi:broad specificity phosphatase PhoE
MSEATVSEPTTLLLLRHGEVASHRGDVPVTETGLLHAVRTGKALAAQYDSPVTMLFGGTRRTRETAEALVEGIGRAELVGAPVDAFALRNPDVYVAGARVNMVSSAASLAEQIPGMTEEQAKAHPWFGEFCTAPDRIGWWLEQDDPPGDNAAAVMVRIEAFARSLCDDGPTRGTLVVGVTHSPVLRSVLRHGTGRDPGEPGYVTGARLHVTAAGVQSIDPYDPLQA